jgi:hypothetical protein
MFKALHRLSKASIGLSASLLMRFALPLFGGLLGIGFFRVGQPSDPEGHSLMILIGYGIAIGLNHSKYVEALDLPRQCSEHPRPFRLASYYLLVDATVHVLTCIPFLILGIVLSTAPFQTAAIVAGLVALCVYGALMWYLKEFPVEEFFARFKRGRALRSMPDATKRALKRMTVGERSFFWGGVQLPVSCLGSHFCKSRPKVTIERSCTTPSETWCLYLLALKRVSCRPSPIPSMPDATLGRFTRTSRRRRMQSSSLQRLYPRSLVPTSISMTPPSNSSRE